MMHDLYPGHQITSNSPASSFLVIDSGDRNISSATPGNTGAFAAFPATQPYNNFKLQKAQSLLQGGFKSVKLTEICFPYAIPNVVSGVNSSFYVRFTDLSGTTNALIDLSGGFYDGKSLATAVQTKLNASAVGAARSKTWTVAYTNGGISISVGLGGGAQSLGFTLYPFAPSLVNVRPYNTKSLLDVMGFDFVSNFEYLTVLDFSGLTNPLVRFSLYAPLTFTKYIDFISNNLTKYQEVNDSSSKTNSTGAVILRLFLNDESSTVPVKTYDASGVVVSSNFGVAGSFPFVVHRQFRTPKVFKWNPGASIDVIDLQLLDDHGTPLVLLPQAYPDFQITFLATEE
jgi:hypothetical protein